MEHRRRHASRLVGARRSLSPVSHRAVARNGDPSRRRTSGTRRLPTFEISISKRSSRGSKSLASPMNRCSCLCEIPCSNSLGGVHVEWVPESETKSWVRYLPPRWIFDGTAVCESNRLSRAMFQDVRSQRCQSRQSTPWLRCDIANDRWLTRPRRLLHRRRP